MVAVGAEPPGRKQPLVGRLRAVVALDDLRPATLFTDELPDGPDEVEVPEQAVEVLEEHASFNMIAKWSKVLGPEAPTAAEPTTRDHELALSAVVDRLRALRRHRDVGFDDLPYE